jgi:FKBP-type peptidyl-prolyl cis-trans isomerase (trigger factor)
MENLAKKENIAVSDDDLKEIAEKEAVEIGISAEKLLKYYKDTNKSQTLLEDKVIDFLKKNNNIKEVNTTENQETTNTEGE